MTSQELQDSKAKGRCCTGNKQGKECVSSHGPNGMELDYIISKGTLANVIPKEIMVLVISS